MYNKQNVQELEEPGKQKPVLRLVLSPGQ